jgi:hypothetical protein
MNCRRPRCPRQGGLAMSPSPEALPRRGGPQPGAASDPRCLLSHSESLFAVDLRDPERQVQVLMISLNPRPLVIAQSASPVQAGLRRARGQPSPLSGLAPPLLPRCLVQVQLLVGVSPGSQLQPDRPQLCLVDLTRYVYEVDRVLAAPSLPGQLADDRQPRLPLLRLAGVPGLPPIGRPPAQRGRRPRGGVGALQAFGLVSAAS